MKARHLSTFRPSPTASARALKLWTAAPATLDELVQDGRRPPGEALAGWRFRGLHTGLLPRVLRRRKFITTFYQLELGYGSVLGGHTVRVEQNGPEELYTPRRRGGREVIEGLFVVQAAPVSPGWGEFPRAALLHYGRADNPWYDARQFRRDYLVYPDYDNPDLLLGKAYVSLGPFRWQMSFFILERLERSPGPANPA